MNDKQGIMDHLRELGHAIQDWERYKSISLEELHRDRDKRNMVLHALLISIQAGIDIANHLIAEYRLEKPDTYRESFQIISDEGLISTSLGEQMADLAGFRNIITHIYWRLNLDEVYAVIQNDLKTIKEFKEVVKELLKEE